MLKIIMKRLENILETEVNKTQAGFRKGRGTRDHIFNLRNIIEKFREIDEELHICFIDYSKAFNCVIHKNLWKTLRDMGIHKNFEYLGSKIEANGKVSHEIKKRTAMAAGQLKKMEKKSGKDKISKQS